MDSREVIVRNKIELQDILMAHIVFVIDCVYQATLLTNRQYLALKCCAQSLPVKATTDLVDTMHGKGEETCKSFLRLLQDTKLTDVLPALRTMPWYSPPVTTSTDPNTTCLDATQCRHPVQVVDNVNSAPKAGLGTGTPIQETGRW